MKNKYRLTTYSAEKIQQIFDLVKTWRDAKQLSDEHYAYKRKAYNYSTN